MEPRTSARDVDIGLTSFYTAQPPLGGRLKVRISDFVVDEVGGEPPEDPDGRYTCAIVRLTNWETNRFVRDASERLGVSRKKINFSGTKDKRGITTRVFTFEAPLESVRALEGMQGVEVQRIYRTDDESALGQHQGNRFTITVRDLPSGANEVASVIETVRREAEAKGGYPNVFGPQRFGAVRATTHLVGERILRGDFIGAIKAYLSPGPPGGPTPEWSAAVAANDFPMLLKLTGPDQGFERAMLNRLVKQPDDSIYALLALPKNLQLLFVSAFQSYLFNRVVSKRNEEGLPLHEALVGDLIAPYENGEMKEEWIPVKAQNVVRVNEELRRGRAVVTGPLPGTEVPYADGQPGRIEEAVLREANVTRSDFIVPEHLEWSSKGLRRAMLLRPTGWRVDVDDDELHPGRTRATVRFSLPRGAYATSVLREFLKAENLTAYG
jgi:tRNA pseudouridine13 synthase